VTPLGARPAGPRRPLDRAPVSDDALAARAVDATGPRGAADGRPALAPPPGDGRSSRAPEDADAWPAHRAWPATPAHRADAAGPSPTPEATRPGAPGPAAPGPAASDPAPTPAAARVPAPDATRAALDLVVGRRPDGWSPAPAPPPSAARAVAPADPRDVVGEVVAVGPGGTATDGSPPGTSGSGADLAGLADRLWDHLEHRLRRSLLLERERRGALPDL